MEEKGRTFDEAKDGRKKGMRKENRFWSLKNEVWRTNSSLVVASFHREMSL